MGEGLSFLEIDPFPDSTIDAPDRLQLAGLYRGIAAIGTITFIPPPRATVVVLGRPVATVQT